MNKYEQSPSILLGLDFGTESVRAILIDLYGNEYACTEANYAHGQVTEHLPHNPAALLPPAFALQYPIDWLDASAAAIKTAVQDANILPQNIIGIGTDFTSCTMLPCENDGTPLCLSEKYPNYKNHQHAWPKLWKHHGAQSQTDDLNRVAAQQNQKWLARYGNNIGLEWLFPKMLEIYDQDREIFDAADVFIEAGDWFVWQLTGKPAAQLTRSTCQAGYKACWSPDDGYPSSDFLNTVRTDFGNQVLPKLHGIHQPPGTCAGYLTSNMAEKLGLNPGTPVSTAIIDAHAAVPGVGIGEPDILVIVMGTSSCHMLCSQQHKLIPGIAGIVKDGIIPGYTGYEMGQPAVGDAFAWLQNITSQPLNQLANQASEIPPGANGVSCIDWFNGCRTPLMDSSLTASLYGLTLSTTPAHIYRAILEATAFGTRWIIDLLTENNIEIKKIILTGGLPHTHPIIARTYADILNKTMYISPVKHGSATGAAILAATAVDSKITGYNSLNTAVQSMTQKSAYKQINPQTQNLSLYNTLYQSYRKRTDMKY